METEMENGITFDTEKKKRNERKEHENKCFG